MATTLGSKAVGSIVKLNENGVPAEYLIIQQGKPNSDLYDDSSEGTWLLRKNTTISSYWDDKVAYEYATSSVREWLKSYMLPKYDSDIQNAMKSSKLPYFNWSGSHYISDRIFLLSSKEVGFIKDNYAFDIPSSDGFCLEYFPNRDGNAEERYADDNWWLRSGVYYSAHGFVSAVGEVGSKVDGISNSNSFGIRPAMVLPSSLRVSESGLVTTNIAPITPSTITLPSTVYGGQSCSVSWSKSTDEDGNLEGYIVERSYNGGSSWSQIYQGTATSTSTTIPFGTGTVMFRVCAYDTQGEKSGWRTSSNKTVVNNRAPGAPPSISVPLAPSGGEALTVTWTAASDADSNLEGYELERQWDGTGAFTQLYKGAALSYRDSIPKGEHTSVIYRVRAYDAMGAKSSYTTSPSRTIENNTAPVITSDLSGDLGVKSDGFTIPYTITDAEQQAVTVTEAVGSLIKRSYQPTLGEQNTFEVTGEYFQKILNGANTVTITAQDTGGKSSVLSLTFTKKVHKTVITLTEPLPSEQQIEVCVLSITGEIPADADCLIEVTNNGADEEPVWEDATADVKAGRNHVFANKTQTNGWAFNFRVTAERGQDGESETGGYIMSIQGGFQ